MDRVLRQSLSAVTKLRDGRKDFRYPQAAKDFYFLKNFQITSGSYSVPQLNTYRGIPRG